MIYAIYNKIKTPINLAKYHRRHKIEANQILRSIESVKGKIKPSLVKLSDDYATEVLGWKGYAPWLYVYCAISNTFKDGWVPDNYYGKVVVPHVKGVYGEISYLKTLSNRFFRSSCFPDVGYIVNGMFLNDDYKIINQQDAKECLFKISDKIILKLDNSRQGKDIFFFSKDSFRVEDILLINGNGVFQEYIRQHDFFEQFAANSVATLRFTSVIDLTGTPSLRACYLRLGQGKDTHVKSASHIRVAINLENGKFNTTGYLPNWLPIDMYPISKIRFENLQVPLFEECVSKILDLHKSMPFVRSIGWDVIIDKNNTVKVMEWNGSHNDIKFSEATQGPCFADLGWEKIGNK